MPYNTSLHRSSRVHVRTLLHVLCLWLLAIWLGGFTFYTAAVIPILHDQLGSPLETGLVTQRATLVLNFLGLATVGLGWVRGTLGRARSEKGQVAARWGNRMLIISTACLAGL